MAIKISAVLPSHISDTSLLFEQHNMKTNSMKFNWQSRGYFITYSLLICSSIASSNPFFSKSGINQRHALRDGTQFECNFSFLAQSKSRDLTKLSYDLQVSHRFLDCSKMVTISYFIKMGGFCYIFAKLISVTY